MLTDLAIQAGVAFAERDVRYQTLRKVEKENRIDDPRQLPAFQRKIDQAERARDAAEKHAAVQWSNFTTTWDFFTKNEENGGISITREPNMVSDPEIFLKQVMKQEHQYKKRTRNLAPKVLKIPSPSGHAPSGFFIPPLLPSHQSTHVRNPVRQNKTAQLFLT